MFGHDVKLVLVPTQSIDQLDLQALQGVRWRMLSLLRWTRWR
jgi:hypothetical protein